ncbi:hypothetical protein [Ramlibacter sp. AN1133]|uniref:hypothetical protein n=1 Tax=Ramlibacter sp. AN1133 TaxID=3133429 RepID=UPI0030BB7433
MTSSRFHRLAIPLALLLADATGAALALAESPMPDPIAPAVIGRPLDQIRPAKPAKAAQAKQAAKPANAAKAVRRPAPAPQAAARPAEAPGAAVAPALPAPAQQALGTGGAEPDAPVQRQAKMALDDRADTRIRADDVGKGTHFARKPLGPGAYFADKDRAAVRRYYDSNPPGGSAPQWQIGQALPAGAAVGAVPKPVMASLPKLPPGHRYVQLGGDILLVAAGSKMVVDGISVRAGR